MVDVPGNGTAAAPTIPAQTGPAAGTASQAFESDFSLRKIRTALVILLGQTFATSILPFTALTLVLVPMTTEFGWTRTQFALAQTSLMLVGAWSVPALGFLVDRVGCRPIIILGTVLVGIVTMAVSQTSSLTMFCVLFALIGFLGSTGAMYAKVTAALFTKHRGKALAIFGVESAIAAAIAPQIIRFLVGEYSWRQSFLIEGVIIIAIVPLLYYFLDEPGTTGGSRNLFKYMKSKKERLDHGDVAPAALEGMSIRQVARDYVFWLIVVAATLAALPRGGLFIYLSPLLTERGFDGQAATANFQSLLTLSGAFGALCVGFMLDKFHDARVAVPFKLLSFVALLMLGVVSAQFGGMLFFTLTAMVWGFSERASRPISSYVHTRFFGLKWYGLIFGVEAFFMAQLLGIMPIIVGWSREAYGSYEPAIWAMSGLLLVAAAIYLVLGPYRYGEMIGATPAKGRT